MNTARIAAVISAYNPPAALIETASQLSSLVDAVIVVDDGSTTDSEHVLCRLEENGIIVRRLGLNRGIAFALNAGVAEAKRLCSPRFFMTLDQDSVLDRDYISNALRTHDQASAAGVDVGFVGANSYNGERVLLEAPIKGFARPFDPWQSGMIIPTETFDLVGGFADELFIDAVDSEFTMRVRSSGLHPIVGGGCNVLHAIGEMRTPTLFGKTVTFWGRLQAYSSHSPTRVYYISRNGILLGRRYFRRFPRWLFRKAYYEVRNHAVRIIFDRSRHKLGLALIAGLAHGLVGQTGRIDRRLEKLL